MEDEADGWEIVTPSAPRGSSPDGEACRDRPSVDDSPEDLVMGCLDPECDVQFTCAGDRFRCAACRLLFCEWHIEHAPMLVMTSHERCVAVAVLRCLGTPLGAAPAIFCFRCCQTLVPGPRSPTQSATFHPVTVLEITNEIQRLRASSLGSLKAIHKEEATHTFMIGVLLLQSLERLHSCTRPWSDLEREWVWRLKDEVVDGDPSWLPQIIQQVRWEGDEAVGAARLIEKAHERRRLSARAGVQVLGCLGRRAVAVVASLGERRAGLIATHAAKALVTLDVAELSCFLELLLDAGEALGAAGAIGGRRAIMGVCLEAAHEETAPAAAFRAEFFWALEARTVHTAAHAETRSSWASNALQELLRGLDSEDELGLLRQRSWVRVAERGEYDAARVEPGWGEKRAFPIAVWQPSRRCWGLEGRPREAESKCAPVMLRCRSRDLTSSDNNPQPVQCQTTGLLLKRDANMRLEHQVGQMLRLLERLIWEEAGLRDLLKAEGLVPDDVRVTYAMAMTGPVTTLVECVEGASTLRSVRAQAAGALRGRVHERSALLEFLRQQNSKADMPRVLSRLACTAAVSAVLSFVAGLGDRHHENFMVTTNGRLLHIDYGYSFGREPLDSVLIHYAVQGERPVTTLQYDELSEALGPDLIKRVFWPVVHGAYLCFRRQGGPLLEMTYTAMSRDSRWDVRHDIGLVQKVWSMAEGFIATRCVMAMHEASANRFICALFRHCARIERGTQRRDQLKELCLRERTSQAMSHVVNAAFFTGRTASSVLGLAAGAAVGGAAPVLRKTTIEVSQATQDVVLGLVTGVRDLLETGGNGRTLDEEDDTPWTLLVPSGS